MLELVIAQNIDWETIISFWPLYMLIFILVFYFIIPKISKGKYGKHKLYVLSLRDGSNSITYYNAMKTEQAFDIVSGEEHVALIARGVGVSNGKVLQIDSIPNNSPTNDPKAIHVYVPQDFLDKMIVDSLGPKREKIALEVGINGIPVAALPAVHSDR